MTANAPMHLIYITSRWNQSTETFVRREVDAALRAGNRVDVVSLKAPGPSDGIVDDSMVDIHHLSPPAVVLGVLRNAVRRPRSSVASLWRMIRLSRVRTVAYHLWAWAIAVALSDELPSADIAVAHFAWVSSTTADVLSQMTDTPFAVFAHAHAIYEIRCQDRYLAARLQSASVVFAESPLIAQDIHAMSGVRAVVMRMGVPSSFVKEFVLTEERLSDPVSVLSVGALRSKKGHDVLIEAVAGLPGVHLRIAGEGPERGALEAQILGLGLGDRVTLLGRVDPDLIVGLLDDSSVFCLASRVTSSGDRDGVPNVLIEAMARGIPTVATSVSGIPDLLGDGCGVVVTPEDVAELRREIRLLIERPSRAISMATAAHARVVSEYTTDVNWRLMQQLLRDCVRRDGCSTTS